MLQEAPAGHWATHPIYDTHRSPGQRPNTSSEDGERKDHYTSEKEDRERRGHDPTITRKMESEHEERTSRANTKSEHAERTCRATMESEHGERIPHRLSSARNFALMPTSMLTT